MSQRLTGLPPPSCSRNGSFAHLPHAAHATQPSLTTDIYRTSHVRMLLEVSGLGWRLYDTTQDLRQAPLYAIKWKWKGNEWAAAIPYRLLPYRPLWTYNLRAKRRAV